MSSEGSINILSSYKCRFLACQIQAIGLASSDAIPDNSFSASTHRSGNEASKGRLNGNGAWSPSGNSDDNDYLQIDLKDQFFYLRRSHSRFKCQSLDKKVQITLFAGQLNLVYLSRKRH